MSRDALLYVADIVAAGEAILRYTDGARNKVPEFVAELRPLLDDTD